MIEGNDKNKRKNKILKWSAFLGLFLIVLGVSYALFSVILEGREKVRVKSGNLNVSIKNETNPINLEGALPESDEAGAKETPYEFDLVNSGKAKVNYTLYLRAGLENDLDVHNIKYNLKKDNNFLASSKYLSETFNWDAGSIEQTSSNTKYTVRKLGTSAGNHIERYNYGFVTENTGAYEYDYSGNGETLKKVKDLSAWTSISWSYTDEGAIIDGVQYLGVYVYSDSYHWNYYLVRKDKCQVSYMGYKYVGLENIFDAYKIDSGVINPGETKHYTLQMWLDIHTTNDAMDRVFEATAVVDAVQAYE